jgi:hypothetical protein
MINNKLYDNGLRISCNESNVLNISRDMMSEDHMTISVSIRHRYRPANPSLHY